MSKNSLLSEFYKISYRINQAQGLVKQNVNKLYTSRIKGCALMIGILNAYHFDVETENQKEYSQLFLNFVQNIFPEQKEKIIEYKIAQGKFPKSVSECKIWFITGSPNSVYDNIVWVHQLNEFVKELHRNKVKTIGICFGHQMIAHALGGEVTKSPKGWGVGIRDFKIIQKQIWMAFAPHKLSLFFSHQDQVNVLPPGTQLLATDDFCPHQIMQIGQHILTMQGHPEFSVKFAKELYVSFKNMIDTETFEEAIQSSYGQNDYKIISDWIRKFVIT